MEKFGNFVFKYRYLFGFLIILISIALDVNGSSVGMWNEAFMHPDNRVIFGTPRAIRTDEWRILTPMTVSQTVQSGTGGKAFSWFSNLLRGTKTDVFMIYSLPARPTQDTGYIKQRGTINDRSEQNKEFLHNCAHRPR